MTEIRGQAMGERAPVVVDGARGEGGGQRLRSSLALSLLTGRPLRMHDIRRGRAKPGLMRQHLTAVRAAAEVGQAVVEGDELRSTELTFTPGAVRAGDYHFAVGTAGSTTLVLQTVLWPLLRVPGPSRLVLEGGTHNPLAPPFEFVSRSLLPMLRSMGASVRVHLERPGFYPAGGGMLVADVEGGRALAPRRWLERGPVRRADAVAMIANLPVSIARRELEVVHERLGWSRRRLRVQRVASAGPGNVLRAELEHDAGCTVLAGFGEPGVSAEDVAARLVERVEGFLAADVPVDRHLADQLLLPLALAGGGRFRTVEPTRHTRTQAELISAWLPAQIEFVEEGAGAWRVEVVAGPA